MFNFKDILNKAEENEKKNDEHKDENIDEYLN